MKAPLSLLALLTAVSTPPGSTAASDQSLDQLLNDDFPVVLSATRLKQPKSETPAAVTVIDQQTIEQLGARSIAEVLRLVPGLYVGYERGHSPEVGYHALASENSRHLQVLVDGRSIYQPALARILWEDLPLSIEKISRIEVIRGPNTAMYGANSYLAVINIITFHPEDQLGGQASITEGNHGISDASIKYASQLGDFAYDVTLSRHQDDGFETSSTGGERYDAHDGVFIASDLIWHHSDNDYLRIQLGASDNERQLDDIDPGELTDFHPQTTKNSFVHLTYNNHIDSQNELKLQASSSHTKLSENWVTCMPALFLSTELYDLFSLSPEYTDGVFLPNLPAPPPDSNDADINAQAMLAYQRLFQNGADTVCGTANQNMTERRIDTEAQWIARVSPNTRIVTGLNYRHDEAESESYFNGLSEKDIWRLFSNIELKPAKKWRVNLGAMYENDSMIGNALTPRLAVNWLFNSTQSFRFIFSRANRSPDLFEQDSQRSYTLRDIQNLSGQPVSINGSGFNALYYQHSDSPGELNYEDIRTWEAGWYYHSFDQSIELDIRLFHETLYNLLEGKTMVQQFDLENSGQVSMKGVEAQFSWHIAPNTRLSLGNSYVDRYNSSNPFYNRSGAKSSWSINGFHQFDNQIKWSNSFYYYDDYFAVDFKRFDSSVAYTFDFNAVLLTTRLTYQHRFDDNHLLDLRSVYTNPDKIYATVSLNW